MNFQEYVPLAVRTAKKLNSKAENLNHAVIGLLSEIKELNLATASGDLVNIKEELGDKLWYAALGYKCLEKYMKNLEPNVDFFVDFTSESIINLNATFVDLLSEFSDYVKKALIYNKELSEEDFVKMATLMTTITGVIFCQFKAFNLNPYEAMEANINKLKQRYPDAYTDENAIDRDTNKEREILENGKSIH